MLLILEASGSVEMINAQAIGQQDGSLSWGDIGFRILSPQDFDARGPQTAALIRIWITVTRSRNFAVFLTALAPTGSQSVLL